MTPVSEKVGKVVSATLNAMKSTPLAIALLVVNVGFLGFAAHILGEPPMPASVTGRNLWVRRCCRPISYLSHCMTVREARPRV
jgi:hypothetical protein